MQENMKISALKLAIWWHAMYISVWGDDWCKNSGCVIVWHTSPQLVSVAATNVKQLDK